MIICFIFIAKQHIVWIIIIIIIIIIITVYYTYSIAFEFTIISYKGKCLLLNRPKKASVYKAFLESFCLNHW